jgi:hypothetical protein
MTNSTRLGSDQERIDEWRTLRDGQRDGYSRWVLLIMELRVQHNASILEAERIALSKRHRSRWVEKQINTHQRCRKYALTHIRYNGDDALIVREGDTFNFKLK